jgi:hypothetical protein
MEWIEFVERNPQYVQAIREDVQQIPNTVMAITSGLDNVQEVITPLEILKERLHKEI